MSSNSYKMGLSSAESTDNDEATKIHQQVVTRKKKQNAEKAQPWKDGYKPRQEEVPQTSSPHDKPWYTADKPWNWEDSEYDTNGGNA